jgi:hypothetical protein
MDVSGITPSSISAQSNADAQAERVILALKKQQDVQKDQAQALVSLVQNAAPAGDGEVGSLISVYA